MSDPWVQRHLGQWGGQSWQGRPPSSAWPPPHWSLVDEQHCDVKASTTPENWIATTASTIERSVRNAADPRRRKRGLSVRREVICCGQDQG